jgi:hypothetical protein
MYEAPGLISRKSAAQFLGVTHHTLGVWASEQRYNLPYVKIGRRAMYRMEDLQHFIATNTVRGGGHA